MLQIFFMKSSRQFFCRIIPWKTSFSFKPAIVSKRKTVGLNLICGATEPFYKDKDDGRSTTLMCFRKIDQSLMDGLQEYMKKHDVKVMLCEQSFYDYEKDVNTDDFMDATDEVGFR